MYNRFESKWQVPRESGRATPHQATDCNTKHSVAKNPHTSILQPFNQERINLTTLTIGERHVTDTTCQL